MTLWLVGCMRLLGGLRRSAALPMQERAQASRVSHYLPLARLAVTDRTMAPDALAVVQLHLPHGVIDLPGSPPVLKQNA